MAEMRWADAVWLRGARMARGRERPSPSGWDADCTLAVAVAGHGYGSHAVKCGSCACVGL